MSPKATIENMKCRRLNLGSFSEMSEEPCYSAANNVNAWYLFYLKYINYKNCQPLQTLTLSLKYGLVKSLFAEMCEFLLSLTDMAVFFITISLVEHALVLILVSAWTD